MIQWLSPKFAATLWELMCDKNRCDYMGQNAKCNLHSAFYTCFVLKSETEIWDWQINITNSVEKIQRLMTEMTGLIKREKFA